MDSYSVQPFIQLLEEEGVDIREVYRRSGLSLKQLQQHESLLKLVSISLNMVSDKSLGLKYGQRLTIPQLGVIGYALMSCASGEAALQLLLQLGDPLGGWRVGDAPPLEVAIGQVAGALVGVDQNQRARVEGRPVVGGEELGDLVVRAGDVQADAAERVLGVLRLVAERDAQLGAALKPPPLAG